jgi:hypothetical protein
MQFFLSDIKEGNEYIAVTFVEKIIQQKIKDLILRRIS